MPYAQLKDVKLFYTVYNKNQSVDSLDPNLPSMIVLHGSPGFDHKHMVPYWSKFSSNLQVIFIDQRGNGLSDKSDSSKWNLNQWACDIMLFCKSFNFKTKPILAGSSFGSYVTQAAITKFPETFSGAILTDADSRIDFDRFLRLLEKRAREENIDIEKAKSAAIAWFKDSDADKLQDYVNYCLPLFVKSPVRDMMQDMEGSIQTMDVMKYFNTTELLKFDFRQALQNIICPVLVLAGDISPYHSEESASELASAIPDKFRKFKLFKGAGSPIYNHVPDLVYEVISDFIKAIIPASEVNMNQHSSRP
jgi:pimeloyl-ACP methyl ester carboxylesterase